MRIFDNNVEAGGVQPPAIDARAEAGSTVKVWDPVVRLFHWSLVIAFTVAWLTGDELKRIHEWAGYTIVGLLVIRILWGFVGTSYARFGNFLYRPSTVMKFLLDTARFRAKRYLGHNPAGQRDDRRTADDARGDDHIGHHDDERCLLGRRMG